MKDVIKSGGEWISSLALESLASSCSGVAEVAAVAVPDAKWGERPIMHVVPLDGEDLDMLDLKIRASIEADILAGNLSKWAMSEQIKFVSKIPKTSVGKINKKILRELYS